ncbi:hypothetical protein DICSQDRAFT_99749 [Dichomitus squalens LYAD-421 SS1]|uniref:uncharacterized protein n=1 Tax=Dichomitus squalens (strain LYAD-421) TaxID=732165 RepID=UPI0004413B9C|nr:uncharacterized protein DICSQDRAFT_99749 [Dichomitus squalens LYAD-421 SS1]EJF64561.1 hypothetical protein DICSQDRAFT_99749 [Dichomitus squalens LYAD-421 SS1]
MAPQIFTSLTARDATDDDSSVNPTIIAGIVLAAVIAAGAAIWLAIRWYRKRATTKRNARRSSAFANFKGFDNASEKSPLPSAGSDLLVKGTFSRDQMNSNIIMPERAVLRPGATREEILEHYTSQGNLPRPFAPFQPQPQVYLRRPPSPGKLPSGRPASNASWIPPLTPLAGGRNSHRMSAMSAVSSVFSTSSGTTQKKVRQIFDPVLPDELVISLGETLTLVQSFDDGWCIAGRDSIFKPGEVELGAVPGWCFVKPVKGLRAERPMRVSSLGVTVDLDAAPTMGPRDNVMSWSNF